jgi:hypothetical protein
VLSFPPCTNVLAKLSGSSGANPRRWVRLRDRSRRDEIITLAPRGVLLLCTSFLMSEVWIVTNKHRRALDDEREIAFTFITPGTLPS